MNISNLTGIRGVAALWVLSLHYQEYLVGLLPASQKFSFLFTRGGYGVDLFFTLSGFILGHVYFEKFQNLSYSDQGIMLKEFLFKRFARLYPVYFITLLIASSFYLIAINNNHKFNHESASNLSIVNFVLNFFGIQEWFSRPSLNGPSWSVSAELAAYLVFPFFCFLFTRSRFKQIGSWSILILSIILYEFSVQYDFLMSRNMWRLFTEFFIGLSAFLIVKGKIFSYISIRFLRMSVLVCLICFLYFVSDQQLLDSVVPVFLVVAVALNYSHNVPSKGLSRRVLVNLGILSYSLYMTHRLLQNVLSGIHYPVYNTVLPLRLIQFFILLICPFFISWVFTKFIEEPSRRLLIRQLQFPFTS